MTKTDSIHQESIDFITHNINAKTSEIPQHLLEYWYTPGDVADYLEHTTDKHTCFLFQHACETYSNALGKEIQLSPLKGIGLFEQFQLIIRVTLGKEKVVKINPIDLFDFDNYSKLNISIL
jgi:hypothetical protein